VLPSLIPLFGEQGEVHYPRRWHCLDGENNSLRGLNRIALHTAEYSLSSSFIQPPYVIREKRPFLTELYYLWLQGTALSTMHTVHSPGQSLVRVSSPGHLRQLLMLVIIFYPSPAACAMASLRLEMGAKWLNACSCRTHKPRY